MERNKTMLLGAALALACAACDNGKDREIESLKAERDRIAGQFSAMKQKTASAIPISRLVVMIQMACRSGRGIDDDQIPRMAVDGSISGPAGSVRLIDQALEAPRIERTNSGQHHLTFSLQPSVSSDLASISLAGLDTMQRLSFRVDAMLSHVGFESNTCSAQQITIVANNVQIQSVEGSVVSELGSNGYRTVPLEAMLRGFSERYLREAVDL